MCLGQFCSGWILFDAVWVWFNVSRLGLTLSSELVRTTLVSVQRQSDRFCLNCFKSRRSGTWLQLNETGSVLVQRHTDLFQLRLTFIAVGLRFGSHLFKLVWLRFQENYRVWTNVEPWSHPDSNQHHLCAIRRAANRRSLVSLCCDSNWFRNITNGLRSVVCNEPMPYILSSARTFLLYLSATTQVTIQWSYM